MKTSTTKSSRKKEIIYTALSILAILAIWKMVATIVEKEIIVPSPESTFKEFVSVLGGETFWISVWNTIKRTMASFFMAMGLALVLGISSGLFNPVYYLLRPLVTAYRAMPSMAIILLALIWLKSEAAPILVGFLVIFPMLYESVVYGIGNVDRKLVEMGRLYKLSRLKMISDIYMPSMKGYMVSASAAAIGLNLKVIIAAEVLSQPKNSIGTSFYIERANLNTAGVFAWSVIAIAIAGALEGVINAVKRNKKGK